MRCEHLIFASKQTPVKRIGIPLTKLQRNRYLFIKQCLTIGGQSGRCVSNLTDLHPNIMISFCNGFLISLHPFKHTLLQDLKGSPI